MLTLVEAVARYINEDHDAPVVTLYDIGVRVFMAYETKTYKGIRIRVRREHALPEDVSRTKHSLLMKGLIAETKAIGKRAFLNASAQDVDPDEVICCLDPFAYISHLSAMAHYGLTDRLPKVTFITSPTNRTWQALAREKMQKDLDGYLDSYRSLGLPHLTRLKLPESGRFLAMRHLTEKIGSSRKIHQSSARVASIGRTYLDMLRTPQMCGGMRHVIRVFEENATSHLKLIIRELDENGTAIERVRAGYILEQYCGVSEDATQHWVRYAQRGGSRKLDPDADYMSDFSERWSLSINV